jgi:hypothetical protein
LEVKLKLQGSFIMNFHGTLSMQIVKIPSNFYTPTIPGQPLPTGQIFRVKDTPYDFTNGRKIGHKLQAADGGPHK